MEMIMNLKCTLKLNPQIAQKGQALVEFALTLPLLLLLALGIIEFSYVLLDQHVLIKMAREGSNLISRNTSLTDAGTAMTAMANTPVDLTSNRSLMIFSVIRKKSTDPTKAVLYKKRQIGSLTGKASILSTSGTCTFTSANDYANAAGVDACVITNLPSAVVIPNSGQIFMTEVYNSHSLITPVGNLGIAMPTSLYANAYF
jgi:Flp pilus assembly protein TadG